MLILASRSAARQSLLAGAGLRFAVSPAPIDERAIERQVLGKGGGPMEVARRLTEAKALSVPARPGQVVIGADQVLALGDDLLHKPDSLLAAQSQLDRLCGHTHRLHAGIALVVDGGLRWSAVDTAALTMRAFSLAERDAVLALEGTAALASVGAYRLEGPSIRLFERIEGDYFTILGLPLLPLLAALRQYAPAVMEDPSR